MSVERTAAPNKKDLLTPEQQTRLWRVLLYGFVLLYPFLLFPTATSEGSYNIPRLGLLLLLGLLSLLQGWSRSLYRAPFNLLLLAHLVLVVVSTLVSPDPDGFVFDLIGSEERGDAVLYQVGLVLLGIFAYRTLLGSERAVTVLLGVLLVVGVLESAVVLAQRSGYDVLILLIGEPGRNFISGTIGHPGMVAGLLLPILLAGLGVYWSVQKPRSFLALAALVVVAVGLGATGNRTSFFALLPVLLLVVVQRRTFGAAALCTVLALCSYGANTYFPVASGGAVGTYTSTKTFETRLLIWDLALDALRLIPGQPFIGGGTDAFQRVLVEDIPIEDFVPLLRLELGWPDNHVVTAILPLYQPSQPRRSWSYLFEFEDETGARVESQAHEVNLDRAHNFLLDRALTYGVLDALLWLLLYGIALWRGLRSDGITSRALAWSLLAVGIYYLTWFPVIQVEPLHVVIVAAAWSLAESSRVRSVPLVSESAANV